MKRIILLFAVAFMFISLASAEVIPLEYGWNFFGINVPNQNDTGTDRNIPLSFGYNLIGMSSYSDYAHANANLTLDNGTVLTMEDAINGNYIFEQFRYYGKDEFGQTGWLMNPRDDSQLRKNKAYFIRLNYTSANLTLYGIGGTYENIPYIVSDLNFTDGSNILSFENAVSVGWIGITNNSGSVLRYWDNGAGYVLLDPIETIYSWQGLTLWANLDGISLVTGSYTPTTPPAGGGAVSGGFGYYNPNLPMVNVTADKFGYYNPNLPSVINGSKFGYYNSKLPKLTEWLIFKYLNVLYNYVP